MDTRALDGGVSNSGNFGKWLKGNQHAAQWSYSVNIFINELIVEIYSNSLIRVIGKVLLMEFS